MKKSTTVFGSVVVLIALMCHRNRYHNPLFALAMILPYSLQSASCSAVRFASSCSSSSVSSSLSHSLSSIASVSSSQVNNIKHGIYLHIPFCRRRCYYCDFPIKVIGDKESTRRSSGEAYTELLMKDIALWSKQNNVIGTAVDTIYFGGGTPSLLPDDCKYATYPFILFWTRIIILLFYFAVYKKA